MYKEKRTVIISTTEQQEIIHDVHKGIGSDPKSKAMASYRGRESTYEKISRRFYWHNMINDVREFIAKCDECQRHKAIPKQISQRLQNVPVMAQIGIDICNLPEVDGFKHLIVCIDYFSKWSEAKPLKNASALSVAEFLYEIICRFGCIRIQINDQGREFVNIVSENLHRMTGTEQRVTSAYHPQANWLCERQTRVIKESLVKVLDENPSEWPYIISGILFAHRVSRHYSTKFSPFYMIYNREPILPIDVKHNLVAASDEQDMELLGDNEQFQRSMFNAVLSSVKSLREEMHEEALKNIQKAQAKQKKDYDRRHSHPSVIKIGDKVLRKDCKRGDRKGGKFSYKWRGPFVVQRITTSGLCTLVDEKGKVRKKKYNVALLKLYLEYDQTDQFSDPGVPVEEKRRVHDNETPDEKEDYGKHEEVGATEVEPDCEEIGRGGVRG